MKRILALTLFFIIIQGFFVSYANKISVFLNGNEVLCTPEPVIFEGRTLIPVRAVFEQMGAAVNWNNDERSVTVVYRDITIKMTIESKNATVNGNAFELDVPAKIFSDRTMIPLRFVGEAIGAKVEWNGDLRRVDISSPEDGGEGVPSVPSVVIKDLSISDRGDYDVFSFNASGKYTLSTMTLTQPDRLVFDALDASVNASGFEQKNGGFVSIRVGNHDGYARIVAETQAPARYIYADNGGIVNIKIYKEKKNYNFLGAAEKKIIFPESTTAITESLSGNQAILSVSGAALSDETLKIGDDLVTEISVSGTKVFVTLKTDASISIDKNTVTFTKAEEKRDEAVINGRLVVLDAGHGGSDPGSLGKDISGENIIAYEKDMNLAITLKVERMLKENGIEVLLTRGSDVYVGLAERAEFANERNAALFVSIHNNSIPQADYKGSMVLYYLESSAGKVLAQNILDEMTAAAGTIDRGLRDGTNMAVIKRTDMPAVIVECGCLTNQEELADLMDDAFLEKLAFGITQGIIKTLNN